jgi:outer membrane lipoprotein
MRTAVLFLGLLLVGCASDIPRTIRDAPVPEIRLPQALAEADNLRGRVVRWGGRIVGVENRKDETWIEIVEQPLASDGSPRRTNNSAGRFLAQLPGFLDPALYTRLRPLTVTGTLDGVITRNIGEHPYRYPLVRVTEHYLWPPEPETVHYHYYYPLYDPWYPWRYTYPRPPPKH